MNKYYSTNKRQLNRKIWFIYSWVFESIYVIDNYSIISKKKIKKYLSLISYQIVVWLLLIVIIFLKIFIFDLNKIKIRFRWFFHIFIQYCLNTYFSPISCNNCYLYKKKLFKNYLCRVETISRIIYEIVVKRGEALCVWLPMRKRSAGAF